jgi:uncharacterized ubiquitin-like protein YukD
MCNTLFDQGQLSMKARVGDYIKTDNGPRRVVSADYNGYALEDGQALADTDITNDDVLLESEVV